VIGAENAKTELAWFTEFLKNPSVIGRTVYYRLTIYK